VSVRHQPAIYGCDLCFIEETAPPPAATQVPPGWVLIPAAFSRPVMHVCDGCQDRPIRELKLRMDVLGGDR
jgi:hypothetical protein